MKVIFGTCSNDKRALNKTLENKKESDCKLKEKTSVINPTLLIKGGLNDFAYYNMFHIADFGRTYYITDVKSVSNDIVEVSGHVDVLTSFYKEIMKSKFLVSRSSNWYNSFENDNLINELNCEQYEAKCFDMPIKPTTEKTSTGHYDAEGNFILITSGYSSL